MNMQTTKRGRQGLASMPPEKARDIQSKGGKASQASGHANRFTSGPDGTATSAGRKGGSISKRRPKKREEQAV